MFSVLRSAVTTMSGSLPVAASPGATSVAGFVSCAWAKGASAIKAAPDKSNVENLQNPIVKPPQKCRSAFARALGQAMLSYGLCGPACRSAINDDALLFSGLANRLTSRQQKIKKTAINCRQGAILSN